MDRFPKNAIFCVVGNVLGGWVGCGIIKFWWGFGEMCLFSGLYGFASHVPVRLDGFYPILR